MKKKHKSTDSDCTPEDIARFEAAAERIMAWISPAIEETRHEVEAERTKRRSSGPNPPSSK